MADRICKGEGCGATISPQSKKGWCKRCAARALNADPEIRARKKAALARYYAQPGVREERAAKIAAYNRNSSPERRAMLREHGLRMFERHLSNPANAAKANSPEAKARAAAAQIDTKLAWCPPERRDEYRRLCASQRLSAAEARRVIEAEIPGTLEHGRRQVANNILKQKLRHERARLDAY